MNFLSRVESASWSASSNDSPTIVKHSAGEAVWGDLKYDAGDIVSRAPDGFNFRERECFRCTGKPGRYSRLHQVFDGFYKAVYGNAAYTASHQFDCLRTKRCTRQCNVRGTHGTDMDRYGRNGSVTFPSLPLRPR
jgi:hypothetical protein